MSECTQWASVRERGVGTIWQPKAAELQQGAEEPVGDDDSEHHQAHRAEPAAVRGAQRKEVQGGGRVLQQPESLRAGRVKSQGSVCRAAAASKQ